MNIHYLDEPQIYDGTALRSHWIYDTTGILGDAVVAYAGKADVKLDHMLDKEDVRSQSPIYSEFMLHFIIEHFDHDLEKMILRQRLFITLLQEELHDVVLPDERVIRRGNDLFIDHEKLSVSIATVSPVSGLIHTGVNIISRNTPVPTRGLEDLEVAPKSFAWSVMNRYVEEMAGVKKARAKVRGVL